MAMLGLRVFFFTLIVLYEFVGNGDARPPPDGNVLAPLFYRNEFLAEYLSEGASNVPVFYIIWAYVMGQNGCILLAFAKNRQFTAGFKNKLHGKELRGNLSIF